MPEIWRQIKEYGIDFEGKSVLDLGGGHGDLCLLAAQDGARKVRYVDNNVERVQEMVSRRGDLEVYTHFMDIEKQCEFLCQEEYWDYVCCLSALPYFEKPSYVLTHIMKAKSDFINHSTAIIECQYRGDGPGFENIRHDDDMKRWLKSLWNNVEAIGRTLVEDRQKYRTIWVCKNEHKK